MIYIIRHGQTEGNKARILQGRSDLPLNETGRQQAGEARDRLAAAGIRFDKVYTSPLQRAVQTAQIVAAGIPQVVEERLIEIDYGPYEGMDLAHLTNEVISFFHDTANVPAPAGMEALPDLIARTGAFLTEIRDEARDKNILLSTHAIAMKGALEYLTPDSHGSYWSTFVPNCAVYTTCVLPDGSYAVPEKWEGSMSHSTVGHAQEGSSRRSLRVVAALIREDGRIFATQRGYGNYKDWWEFPGGKIEEGETPEEALVREIREELGTEISVDEFLTTVEYDYPEFHLVMDCYWCSVTGGELTLLEHEAAKWLPEDDLRQVQWLPADLAVIERI